MTKYYFAMKSLQKAVKQKNLSAKLGWRNFMKEFKNNRRHSKKWIISTVRIKNYMLQLIQSDRIWLEYLSNVHSSKSTNPIQLRENHIDLNRTYRSTKKTPRLFYQPSISKMKIKSISIKTLLKIQTIN